MSTRRHSVLHSPMPRAWVWPWITDLEHVTRWSGFDRCLALDERSHLVEGAEWDCAFDVDGYRCAATLSVLHADEPAMLSLRTSAPLMSLVETFSFVPYREGTLIHYDITSAAQLSPQLVEAWRRHHVETLTAALRTHLRAVEGDNLVAASGFSCGCEEGRADARS